MANVEKAQAEAKLIQWQAKREELFYAEEKLNLDHQLNGVYSFNRMVTDKSVDRILRAMQVWHHHDSHAPWTIYLNSVGGQVFAGNALVDELIAMSLHGGGTHEVTIKARGVAASMGGLILQAADHRLMGVHSQLMIHAGGSEIHGHLSHDEMADEVEWNRNGTERMADLFLSRTGMVTRGYFMKSIERRDWWLSSEEAVQLGFADGIG